MYRSFRVRNFRCFRDLSIAELQRVNLIAGVNNVGKTALLEALFLHCGATNPALTMSLNAFRGIESVKVEFGTWVETPWDSFFANFDTSGAVELEGENEATGHRRLALRVVRDAEELARIGRVGEHEPDASSGAPLTSDAPQVLGLDYEDGSGRRGSQYLVADPKGIRLKSFPAPPPFPAVFLGSRIRIRPADDAERFSNLEVKGQQGLLTGILQIVEPRLRRVAVVVSAGAPVLQGDVGLGRLVALPLMGEGMVRLASLALAIANMPKGVVLVDEIENGLHHALLTKVWQAVGEVAQQFNVQVFATTHSFECIAAAHEAFSMGGSYDFALHRLERVNGTIRAVRYEQATLAAAIETGLEVR